MDNHSEVRDSLTSRRAKLSPEQVGLPPLGDAGCGEARSPSWPQ